MDNLPTDQGLTGIGDCTDRPGLFRIPVFHVKDVDAAIKFYTEVLGFVQSFRMGTYVGLKIGKCEIHICPRDGGDFGPRIGGGNAYIICDEVDEYFKTIKASGAKPKSEPADAIYGMRDFVIFDPDGNQTSSGCDIEGTFIPSNASHGN